MLIEHLGKRPQVDPTTYVAPNAVVCGDVTIGPHSRVLFGAVLTAEGGPLRLGAHCIVMENAVIRSTRHHPVDVGSHCLVGPRAYLTGCTVANHVFLATGATVFNGATIGEGAEVRINGVVHLRTAVPAQATVPIGWVAVGDPAEIHPPDKHDEIWETQRHLDFLGEVFGLERPGEGETIMPELTRRYGRALATHFDDHIISDRAADDEDE